MKGRILILLALIFVQVLCDAPLACAQEQSRLEIPLMSSSAKVLFREDFRRMTEIIAETYDVSSHETLRLAVPYYGESAIPILNLSYGYFMPLADWLYIPLYGAVTIFGSGQSILTLLAGTGFVLDFCYLTLGAALDFSYDSTDVPTDLDHYNIGEAIIKYRKHGFSLYPVLNTREYPFLNYLDMIVGELIVKDTESPSAMFETFAWMSRLVFKYLFGIPVFDLYAKSGKNDFFPEYDMSELYTGFKSYTYGGVIGTETFSVEVSYTMITGAFIREKDVSITDVQNKEIEYPFGLNGFPALVLHYRPGEDWYWYLRLSTTPNLFFFLEDNFKKYPVVPTLGFAHAFAGKKSSALLSFTLPNIASVAWQIYM